MNNPIVTSLLVALVVVGGVLAGGYFGMDKIQGMLQAGQPEAQHIIIELKDVAIGEIRSAKSEAIDEIKKLNAEIITEVRTIVASAGKVDTAEIEDIKMMVERIDANQKGLAERLATMNEQKIVSAAQVPAQGPAAEPGMGMLVDTVYFPLAIAKGPKIDVQLEEIITGLKKHAGKDQCQVNISGFSDTLGNDDINLELSQERADYVADKLKADGLTIGTVRGWGERRLKVHTLDGEDNEKNRRVEIEMNCASTSAV